jgi:hypothetical protein
MPPAFLGKVLVEPLIQECEARSIGQAIFTKRVRLIHY